MSDVRELASGTPRGTGATPTRLLTSFELNTDQHLRTSTDLGTLGLINGAGSSSLPKTDGTGLLEQ